MSSDKTGDEKAEYTTGKCPACKVDNVRLKDVNGIQICEKCASKRFSSRVRKTIQEAFERQQDLRQKEAYRRRIDVARRGVRLFEDGKFPEALKNFRDYISLLEAKQGVPPGGLKASLFDNKKDAGEILLIAGIFWDMVKIFDHMKGQQNEMRYALNKFIEFSMDRPHLILASEALRKYLASDNIVNKKDIAAAYEMVTRNLARCFIVTAVAGPDAPELRILRNFRDEVLMNTMAGRRFVATYYALSPALARYLAKRPPIAAMLRRPIRFIAYRITDPMRDGLK